jgi:acyl-CoA synthetase (AMP-forming)/AMP-acid ligase II
MAICWTAENVIAAHLDVVEVFGIADERSGEQVAACTRAGASATEKELVELCSVHLDNYKRCVESAGRRQLTARGTLALMSQEGCSIHLLHRVL